MLGFFRKKSAKKQAAPQPEDGAVCSVCGMKLSKAGTYLMNGEKCCRDCYQKKNPDKFCCKCGKEGPLYIWDGKKYCNSCYMLNKQNNVCGFCCKTFGEKEHAVYRVLSAAAGSGASVTYKLCDACSALLKERGISNETQLMMQPEYKQHYEQKKTPPKPRMELEERTNTPAPKTAVPSAFGRCYICQQKKPENELSSQGLTMRYRLKDVCPECNKTYYIEPRALAPKYNEEIPPVRREGQSILLDSKALRAYCLVSEQPLKFTDCMPLTEKQPVIRIIEDGVNTRNYTLENGPEDDYTGMYFQLCVLAYYKTNEGYPDADVVQIDGLIAKENTGDAKMTTGTPAYRFEVYYPVSDPFANVLQNETVRGGPLESKALRYPGLITPTNVSLVGICGGCGRSFAFKGYFIHHMQCVPVYSDDGVDVMALPVQEMEKAAGEKEWAAEANGKRFRYWNPFRCPHCGEAYIDYQRYPKAHQYGELGCALLGHEVVNYPVDD